MSYHSIHLHNYLHNSILLLELLLPLLISKGKDHWNQGRFSNASDINGNSIPSSSLAYSVSVAIKMTGSPTGSFGNACTITTPGEFLSELRPQFNTTPTYQLTNLSDQLLLVTPTCRSCLDLWVIRFKNTVTNDYYYDTTTGYYGYADGKFSNAVDDNGNSLSALNTDFDVDVKVNCSVEEAVYTL